MLNQQIQFLINKGYWDAAALSVYKKELKRKNCKECFFEARLIGSPLYTKMFRASRLPAELKAELPIYQMGGFLDENHMLQLERVRYETAPEIRRILFMEGKKDGFCFYPKMDPNGRFLEMYANVVAGVYGKSGLHNRVVHQFRMYLDLHNILYIRNYFEGETDLEKLKHYEKWSGKSLDYSSSSLFHNRVERGKETAYVVQVNDKIKSHNGLSEFIVKMRTDEYGRKGDFVSQWNHLRVDDATGLIDSDPKHYTKEEYKGIVETESFNYCKSDIVLRYGRFGYHTRLDVTPASATAGYESDAKLQGKKYWVVAKSYKEHIRK